LDSAFLLVLPGQSRIGVYYKLMKMAFSAFYVVPNYSSL
jgi:hypothetical protein